MKGTNGSQVKAVVIGFGGMGRKYAEILAHNKAKGIGLHGICCRNREGQNKIRELYPHAVIYQSTDEVFAHKKEFDAVVIVTPHKTHVEIAKQAFACGKHVICDKPAGIHTREVRDLLAQKPESCAFAMMFNTRTKPVFQKAKELLKQGALGEVTRAVWVCNIWFRTPCYHSSAPWRSSWKGEQGGLLINQWQHFLDIWQWLFGMPDAMYASLDFGKFNDFLVDDSGDLLLFYDRGMRGVMISSSGENPGVNRLEIWGSKGLMTITDSRELTVCWNQPDLQTFRRENQEIYGKPDCRVETFRLQEEPPAYETMLENFAEHIRTGIPLIAPGEEGLNSLMLANAAYLSSWRDQKIKFPIDDEVYAGFLERKISEETENS